MERESSQDYNFLAEEIRSKNRKINPTIEEVLSSKGRVVILKTLAEKEELNISAIARAAKLNHNTTTKHLKFLADAGLVQEKKFGRIKIFRFCIENLKAKSLKKLFEIWQ